MEDKVNIHLPIPGEKGFKVIQKKLIKQALYLSLGLSHNSLEEFIKEMMRDDDFIEIQRNELAEHFKCVPSQINYVISTRFRPSQGYYVESRRGGRRTY